MDGIKITTDWLQSKWGFVLDNVDGWEEWYIPTKDGMPPSMYFHNGQWLFTANSPDGRICVEEKVITHRQQLCDLMKVLEIDNGKKSD